MQGSGANLQRFDKRLWCFFAIDGLGRRLYPSILSLAILTLSIFLYCGRSDSGDSRRPQVEPAFSERVSLVLKGGLWGRRATEDMPVFVDLQLDLRCRATLDDIRQGTNCDEVVWGYGIEFNKADHRGQLVQLEVERTQSVSSQKGVACLEDSACAKSVDSSLGNRIQLQIQMRLNPDK